MQPVTLLLLSLVVLPVAYGQESASDNSATSDDVAVQQLIDKFKDLQPPDWTYSDLASKSDLIVIAKAKSGSEIDWANEIGGDFGKETAKLIANRLRVLSVLKGQSGDEIDVMTLEWKPDVTALTTHDFAELRTELLLPFLAEIRGDGQVTGYVPVQLRDDMAVGKTHTTVIQTYKIEPEYLLYLRRLEGDRYVPVTGQRYSGLSVRMLND